MFHYIPGSIVLLSYCLCNQNPLTPEESMSFPTRTTNFSMVAPKVTKNIELDALELTKESPSIEDTLAGAALIVSASQDSNQSHPRGGHDMPSARASLDLASFPFHPGRRNFPRESGHTRWSALTAMPAHATRRTCPKRIADEATQAAPQATGAGPSTTDPVMP